MGDLMTHETLYYALQGSDFVDVLYICRNFRQAKVLTRSKRRRRVASGERPKGRTTEGEYKGSYRRYTNSRHANRREEEIPQIKIEQQMAENAKTVCDQVSRAMRNNPG